jgi:hypothetical protein
LFETKYCTEITRRLAIDERVESRLAKWQVRSQDLPPPSISYNLPQDTLAKELEDQRKATQFKASDARVLTSAPFVTKPSDKPLSEISNFTLHR